MRRVSLLGISLILVGLLLLFSELGIIRFYWRDLLKLWPLIFIFWGLDLLIGEKKWFGWLVVLIIFLLTIFIVFFSSYGRPFFRDRGPGFYYREWKYPFKEDIKGLGLEISTGVRVVRLEALKDRENLLHISSNWEFYIDKVIEEKRDGELELSLRVEDEKENGFRIFDGDKRLDPINISINPEIPLSLKFDVGVGDATLNMRGFRLKDLSVKGGVGRLKIYLPSSPCYVEIEGGVGSVEVYVPEDMVLDLSAETGLGKISVDKEIKQGKGGEKEVIRLNVRSGVGNIKILSEKREVI